MAAARTRPFTLGALWYLIPASLFEAASPIIAHRASERVPPVLFLAFSAAFAAVCLLPFFVRERRGKPPIPARVFLDALGVAVFIFCAFSLIFLGTRETSGINTALLLQAEVFFAFIVGVLFLRETLTLVHALGGVLILIGGACILSRNGVPHLLRGEWMILLATAIFPFGNLFAKRAMRVLKPIELLFIRYCMGAPLLFLLASFTGPFTPGAFAVQDWLLAGLYGACIWVFAKTLWYRVLRTTPLNACTAFVGAKPALSLVLAVFVLHEVPTAFQLIGFGFIAVGLPLILLHVNNPPEAPDMP